MTWHHCPRDLGSGLGLATTLLRLLGQVPALLGLSFPTCSVRGSFFLYQWLAGKKLLHRNSRRCGFDPWVGIKDPKDPLEKGTATLSSILAWKIPWTEGPGWLQPMGLQRVRQDWGDRAHGHKQSKRQDPALLMPFLTCQRSSVPSSLPWLVEGTRCWSSERLSLAGSWPSGPWASAGAGWGEGHDVLLTFVHWGRRQLGTGY